MAGYYGYSKSNNAVNAERDGRYPLTKAVKELARLAGITQKQARAVLESQTTTEYHHTGSWFNCTDYYDVNDIIEKMNDGDIVIPQPKQTKNLTVTFGAYAEWTDWGGTRNYPRAYPQARFAVITYKDGGTFLTIDGQRKKISNIKLNGRDADDVLTDVFDFYHN